MGLGLVQFCRIKSQSLLFELRLTYMDGFEGEEAGGEGDGVGAAVVLAGLSEGLELLADVGFGADGQAVDEVFELLQEEAGVGETQGAFVFEDGGWDWGLFDLGVSV